MAQGFLDLVGTPMLMTTGTNPLTIGTNGAAALRLLTNGTLRWSIDSSGNGIMAGRSVQTLTPTDVDAQNNTFTVAQAAAGIVVHTSVTGAGTVTTDTAANFIAGSSGSGALAADGQCLFVYYINDGTQTLTLSGGTGVTLADAGQTIAADEAAMFILRRTSATAVTLYSIGA